MKKVYNTPELEMISFKLSADILELSYEVSGQEGGGVIPTEYPDLGDFS